MELLFFCDCVFTIQSILPLYNCGNPNYRNLVGGSWLIGLPPNA